jgi:hypothetical protein
MGYLGSWTCEHGGSLCASVWPAALNREAYPEADPRLEGADRSLPLAGVLLMLLPGALTVYLAFNSGGVFPVTTAAAVLIGVIAMLACVALARAPLAGIGPAGLLAAGSLALLALWMLLSAQWSHAPGRALAGFDRVLLYLVILVLFACVPRSPVRLRWMLRGLLAGSAVVAVIALLSRVLPAWWPTKPGLVDDRLSYPITYWNTLGLLAGAGCVLALHHACDEREPVPVRALGAALLPLLSATLLLTLSRGAIGATLAGALAYLLLTRPRCLPGGLLATAPSTAFAVWQTYSAELVQKGTPLTPAALAQAHRLALVLVICALAAALSRVLLAPLDSRLRAFTASARVRRTARILAAIGAATLLLVALIPFHGASWTQRQYQRFVKDTHDTNAGQRTRLLYVGNDGRLPLWRVAVDASRQDHLKGTGAGTYRLQWERHQSGSFDRVYPYSVYLGTLSELGLLGLCLLGGTLLTILVALARRVRGAARPAHAAAFALVLAWLLHAGIDLDWETPAVSVFAFALGGLALARPAARAVGGGLSSRYRPILALACVALAVVPAEMALAHARLQSSVEALDAGSCPRAERDAHSAIALIDTGARAYEVLAMCAARRNDPGSAVAWARTAVSHDPSSWEPHYVLALADGSAGIDPRAQARLAYMENPLGMLPRLAVRAFAADDPRAWKLASSTLPFWFI